MNMPKFSIIIPTHNGEQTIGRMLDSIENQKFRDYELIVICDACTDRTEQIARERGAIVRAVDFCNDGLTRNAGLDIATGEWILFADDDDWFLHEYVLEMLDGVIGKQGEQMMNFSFIRKGHGYVEQMPADMAVMCWSRCCRRDFIGETRFRKVPYGSDCVFFDDLIAKRPDIAFWNTPMYYYNDNNRSVREFTKAGGDFTKL